MARIGELTFARGNRGLLLLAVAAGLVAAVLVFVALANNNDSGSSSVATGGGTVKAVVAAQNIAAGTQIETGMVKVIDVPQGLLVTNALSDTAPVVGQTARIAINQGEQITANRVGAQAKGDGLGYVVAKGMRAVGVKVDEKTAVGGLLLPGSRVDVIAVYKGGQGQDKTARVETVLQNIEVLAVAQEAQEPLPVPDAAKANASASSDLQTSGQLPSKLDTKPGAGTVTLSVDPQQAQVLVGVQTVADNVWLSLRSAGEGPPAEVPPAAINGQ